MAKYRSPEVGEQISRRGARLARREEAACSPHVTDEQRSQAGCIGGPAVRQLSGRGARHIARFLRPISSKPDAIRFDPRRRAPVLSLLGLGSSFLLLLPRCSCEGEGPIGSAPVEMNLTFVEVDPCSGAPVPHRIPDDY